MTVTAPPASAGDALGMLASAMRYLAVADAAQMAAEVQAQCLKGLEQAAAAGTAARASILCVVIALASDGASGLLPPVGRAVGAPVRVAGSVRAVAGRPWRMGGWVW